MKKVLVTIMAMAAVLAGLNAKSGLSSYTFLEMPSSAYQAAQGGDNVALRYDGVNNVFSNMSLVTEENSKQLQLSYSRYLNTSNIGSAAYAHTWNGNTFAGGVRFVDYGSFDGYDEVGNSTGTFTAKDIAIVLGYSRMLYDGLSVGVDLKPIISAYEDYNSFALSVDVSASYIIEKIHLTMGLAFQNIGRQIVTYDDDVHSLPFNIAFSINKGFKHAPVIIHFTYDKINEWDLSYTDRVTTTNMLGVEKSKKISVADMLFRHTLWGLDFVPMKGKLRVSVSYNHRRGQELKLVDKRSIAGFSFGAGLNLKKFNVGVGASQYQSGVWNWQFNVGLNFDNILSKKK